MHYSGGEGVTGGGVGKEWGEKETKPVGKILMNKLNTHFLKINYFKASVI